MKLPQQVPPADRRRESPPSSVCREEEARVHDIKHTRKREGQEPDDQRRRDIRETLLLGTVNQGLTL